jgi:hypothetical protein
MASKRTNYRKRVLLPEFSDPGDSALEFRTNTGLVIARGYVRVEFGGRGPYIEFRPDQIVTENIRKIDAPHYWFHEYRSNDEANVMLYLQREGVDYAHYVPGLWYVSPFDLTTDRYPVLVTPLAGKAHPDPEPSIWDVILRDEPGTPGTP